MDKIFLWRARTILRIKSNTCNLITLGGCGVLPPNIICHKQALCYYMRFHAMRDNSLVKKASINLRNLAVMGFRNWITNVRELASKYMFQPECEKSLERKLIFEWDNIINDVNKFPSLRTYRILKTKYQLETYLYLVKMSNIEWRFLNSGPAHT